MSKKLDEAIKYAVTCHEGQCRRFENIPYIVHPLEVLSIVATLTDNEDVMIASVLHDVVEDCEVNLSTIEDNFGSYVALLVDSETEKRNERNSSDNWEMRKKESIKILENSQDINIKILWLADKLSNIRSFYRRHAKGIDVWAKTHQPDLRKQAWYYRSVLENVAELKSTVAYLEYKDLLNKLFEGTVVW